MKIIIVSVIFWSSVVSASAQNMPVVVQRDTLQAAWENVAIVEITSRETPKGVKVMGENTLKIAVNSISSVNDLSQKQLEILKKEAAKQGANVVYVDAHGVYDSEPFPPMQSQGMLYYYYAIKKD